MEQYVGLDVSLEETAVCVLDSAGKIVWRGRCSSDPEAIARIVRERAPFAVRLGLETGQLSTWLKPAPPRSAGRLPGCPPCQGGVEPAGQQDRRQRCPWPRPDRADRLVPRGRGQEHGQSGCPSSADGARPVDLAAPGDRQPDLLKTFGLRVGQAGGSRFAVRVRELVPEHPVLVAIVEPLLTVWQTLREQIAELDRQVRMRVREERARRLMTAPGVEAVVALAYTAVIDDPTRFAKSMGAASLMLQVCCAVLNDKLGPASVGHPKLTSILLPTWLWLLIPHSVGGLCHIASPALIRPAPGAPLI